MYESEFPFTGCLLLVQALLARMECLQSLVQAHNSTCVYWQSPVKLSRVNALQKNNNICTSINNRRWILTDSTRQQWWSSRGRCERCRGCCKHDVQPTYLRTLWLSTDATATNIPAIYTHTSTEHERKRRLSIDSEVDCTGAHPLFQRFEPIRVKPNKASIQQKSAGWLALLTVSAFKLTGVNRAYCYAELAVSSLAAV